MKSFVLAEGIRADSLPDVPNRQANAFDRTLDQASHVIVAEDRRHLVAGERTLSRALLQPDALAADPHGERAPLEAFLQFGPACFLGRQWQE